MPENEHQYLQSGLDCCKLVKEIPLCASCAWELEKDMENEEFVKGLKKRLSKRNRMNQD